ncbi:endothelial cell-selective adhesion molecule isoform X2 [Brienomyrus brachyistius]|uniref:endothelial cell-selective adhesion molecule isoform X2 n=1 Tax=Brienomyrus brachyistius TaxID=42636 RepID=UPI0020B21BA7|nr:endothelial cell-selective adhesion molecule isoform X2 [Brienomyrus brachyistius]
MPTSGKLDALVVLTLLWACPGDSQRVEMPRMDVEVVKGQMVVLQAWYSPTSDISKNTVIWNFMANDSKQVISYSSGQIGIGSPDFRSRVGFALSMPSTNLSIFINNTQEADTGRYLCNVIVPGAPGLSGELSLNVKVPPSVPVCEMTGTPVLRGNVTLNCRSTAGKPAPHYKWTKSAPVAEVFFSPTQNEKQGTLRLSNLSQAMSGKYVCRASNTAGAETCYVNLEVSVPTNAGMIVGAALGSILGLVAIIIFLVFIVRKKRGENDDDMANEIKEDALAPRRVSWARSGVGTDDTSKNSTLSSMAGRPRPENHYPHTLVSNGGCVTATGSCAGYRLQLQDPSVLQGLPGYTASGSLPRLPTLVPQHSKPMLRTVPAQPQAPSTTISHAAKAQMIAVPVAVPARSQAGSLV